MKGPYRALLYKGSPEIGLAGCIGVHDGKVTQWPKKCSNMVRGAENIYIIEKMKNHEIFLTVNQMFSFIWFHFIPCVSSSCAFWEHSNLDRSDHTSGNHVLDEGYASISHAHTHGTFSWTNTHKQCTAKHLQFCLFSSWLSSSSPDYRELRYQSLKNQHLSPQWQPLQ